PNPADFDDHARVGDGKFVGPPRKRLPAESDGRDREHGRRWDPDLRRLPPEDRPDGAGQHANHRPEIHDAVEVSLILNLLVGQQLRFDVRHQSPAAFRRILSNSLRSRSGSAAMGAGASYHLSRTLLRSLPPAGGTA